MSKTSLRCIARAAVTWCAMAALVAGGGPRALAAGEIRSTSDFRDVAAVVDRYADKFGAENVLLVLDLDNTLMAMNDDLGSDQWFEWQKFLIAHEPQSPFRVADTFDGLLEVQGLLYNLGHMHPTQPELPAIIARLQGRGVKAVVLTSRGPDFRVATERELKRNNFDFAVSAFPVKDMPNGDYLAYDPEKPEQDGLTPAEIEAYNLHNPKPISYDDGIMMTAGQHKGMMLLTLLHHGREAPKAIVYVDDNDRHVANVFSSAISRNLEITAIDSQLEDERMQAFEYGDKSDVTRRWHRLSETLQAVFE